MKTLVIFALLAIAATNTIAQQQHFPQQPQPYPQQPQPYPQQPFPPQQPFQQQPAFWWQQPIQSQQQPCQQQQQTPLPQGQQYQPLLQQQIPFVHPSILQQLNPCKVFLQQQCSPVPMPQQIARSQMLQQSSCHVLQQQCCQQLPQIPEQFRHEAIRAIIYSIILQQQQQVQDFVQPQQQQPQQSVQGVYQSQQQSQLQRVGQCSFQQPELQQLGQQEQVPQGPFLQPHQMVQLEVMTSVALRTLSTMCNVNVPLYDITTSVPFSVGTGAGPY